MKSKRIIIKTIFIVLNLALCASIVSAQGPPPPYPESRPGPRIPQEFDDWLEGGKTFLLPAMRSQDSGSDIESVTLGSPGFVFKYQDTFGVTEEAYPSSTAYLNKPAGLFIDGSDNMFVTERNGCRVHKYNSSGTNLLSIGTAGLCHTDDYVLSGPWDIALDGSGNIWVASSNRVVQYDSSGNFLQTLPEENSWEPGSDNTHFDSVMGVAFDSSGRMFVADQWNQRVQVYTFSGSDPVYHSTIGETGVSGSDNSHFDEPHRLVVDSTDRLYVVDHMNGRVQQCTESTGWSCTNFDSGLSGSMGITIDSSDNVYIADGGNSRIRKCTPAGSCTDFVTGLEGYVIDVAVDSSDNLFASDWTYNVIRKYNSSAVYQGIFLGTVDTPYLADTSRINTPSGIAVASDGSIYLTEPQTKCCRNPAVDRRPGRCLGG